MVRVLLALLAVGFGPWGPLAGGRAPDPGGGCAYELTRFPGQEATAGVIGWAARARQAGWLRYGPTAAGFAFQDEASVLLRPWDALAAAQAACGDPTKSAEQCRDALRVLYDAVGEDGWNRGYIPLPFPAWAAVDGNGR